ncbi:MAG: type III glutamate--ammonia ligase, partial [Pseudomonadota bacterium]
GRFELRLADGAVNPYLYPAAILAAGMDGIEHDRDPGPRLDIDMYAEPEKAPDARQLPRNLLDALRALEADTTLVDDIGRETIGALLKLRHDEWSQYMRHLSAWERDTTLDC